MPGFANDFKCQCGEDVPCAREAMRELGIEWEGDPPASQRVMVPLVRKNSQVTVANDVAGNLVAKDMSVLVEYKDVCRGCGREYVFRVEVKEHVDIPAEAVIGPAQAMAMQQAMAQQMRQNRIVLPGMRQR